MGIQKQLSYKSIVALGFLVYFFSYAMRLDYSASLVAMVEDLRITNTAASVAVTGSFITYGIGQIICGFVGDKVPPTKMITLAMLGTILVNVLVSFFSSITAISVLWCFNGFFQAMLWPPLCRFVSEQVEDNRYANAITIVGLSCSFGTLFVYFFVPIVLKLTVWRNVFRCMSVFGIIIMLIWVIATKNIMPLNAKTVQKAKDEKNFSLFKTIWVSGLVTVFIIIVLQGMLRDGIQTWLPSLINSTFSLDASTSVLSSTLIPLLSIVSVILSNAIYNKLKNELKTAAIMFCLAAVVSVPIALGVSMPFFVSLFLTALISGCMHGVNHMLISLVPKRFSKYGKVSTFSGLVNSFTYVGASASSVGFAALSDNFGWNSVLISWCVISILGALLCIYKIKGWTAFIKEA